MILFYLFLDIMDSQEEYINPPSRLDLDTEIHQAITMAHRINEKLSMASPSEEQAEEITHENPPLIEPLESQPPPPPPSASKKNLVEHLLQPLSKDEIVSLTVIFLILTCEPLLRQQAISHLPQKIEQLWTCLGKYSFVLLPLWIVLIYCVIIRVYKYVY